MSGDTVRGANPGPGPGNGAMAAPITWNRARRRARRGSRTRSSGVRTGPAVAPHQAGVGIRSKWLSGSTPRFDLARQAQTYDPEARFVKLWIPELRNFPPDLAHRPWEASAEEQEAAGCIVGIDYVARSNVVSEAAAVGEDAGDSCWAEVEVEAKHTQGMMMDDGKEEQFAFVNKAEKVSNSVKKNAKRRGAARRAVSTMIL